MFFTAISVVSHGHRGKKKRIAVCAENRRATFAVQYGLRNYWVYGMTGGLFFWKRLGKLYKTPRFHPKLKKNAHTQCLRPKIAAMFLKNTNAQAKKD